MHIKKMCRARLHRRFLSRRFDANFIALKSHPEIACVNGRRFQCDLSPRFKCKLMQTTKIAVIVISGFATKQDGVTKWWLRKGKSFLFVKVSSANCVSRALLMASTAAARLSLRL